MLEINTILKIAKVLDSKGHYEFGDKIVDKFEKIAQAPSTDPNKITENLGDPGRPWWQSGYNSWLWAKEKFQFGNQDKLDHLMLNYVNSILKSITEIKSSSLRGVFRPNPTQKTQLTEADKYLSGIKKAIIKLLPAPYNRQTNIIDNDAMKTLKGANGAEDTWVDATDSLLDAIYKNFLNRGPDYQKVSDQAQRAKLFLHTVYENNPIPTDVKEEADKVNTDFNTGNVNRFNRNPTQYQKDTEFDGWKMPESFKVVSTPQSAPDIFGGTKSGTKALVERNVAELSGMSDEAFSKTYQDLRYKTEKAFTDNEDKFTPRERNRYRNEMERLEKRYNDIVFKDKPKPSFMD